MPKNNSRLSRRRYIKKLEIFWTTLIGRPSLFSLESRLFHSISICVIAIVFVYTLYDLYAGMYVASVSTTIIGGAFFYQYYNSRKHQRAYNTLFFGLLGLLIFGINYFANSGVHGSTDVIMPGYLLILLAISPYRQQPLWFLLYLITFFGLYGLEYYYPEWISYPFYSEKEQLLDRITALPLPLIAVYIIVKFMRRNYDTERRHVEFKNAKLLTNKKHILRQNKLLEENNVVKSKLMSIISHDLRSPLINIHHYIQLLKESELEKGERQMMEEILLKSTEDALLMLNNLLHWSKSQMGGLRVNLQPADLWETLQHTLDMEQNNAAKKQIVFQTRIAKRWCVRADKDMLQLVVRNLLSNAIKFTPSGGQVTISAKSRDGQCCLIVEDTGNGIPENKQAQIFNIKTEPAYGTQNEKGAGLGLVLCREFVEKQGGSISFESQEGKGTQFFVCLPLCDAS